MQASFCRQSRFNQFVGVWKGPGICRGPWVWLQCQNAQPQNPTMAEELSPFYGGFLPSLCKHCIEWIHPCNLLRLFFSRFSFVY